MASTKRLRSIALMCCVMLGTCVTGWILIAGNPESFELTSDDGLLHISGISHNSKALYITSNTLGDFTTYSLLPESLARQAQLSVHFSGEGQSFVMDPTHEAWRPIESQLSSQGHVLFATGSSVGVDLANYDAWRDEALMNPPEGAVSYEQFVTYQISDALPSYLAEDTIRQMSCEDTFFRTRHVEERKDFKEVRIPVDGVSRLVRLTLTTKWFINSEAPACIFAPQE